MIKFLYSRIVVVGIGQVVRVVEVELVVVGLEVERIVGGLPEFCLFPSISTGEIA